MDALKLLSQNMLEFSRGLGDILAQDAGGWWWMLMFFFSFGGWSDGRREMAMDGGSRQ